MYIEMDVCIGPEIGICFSNPTFLTEEEGVSRCISRSVFDVGIRPSAYNHSHLVPIAISVPVGFLVPAGRVVRSMKTALAIAIAIAN